MKTKILSLLVLGFVLFASACSLHDDTENFDAPAAERIENTVSADKALLESSLNGWQLHLWTGRDYTGGGYTYLMKFHDGKVTVASDIAKADTSASSSYDVISDQGPVLTLNTYNAIFHYLAYPSLDGDDGEQQDYEFVITRTTNDSIFLRGKKWGNSMFMTRISDNTSWSDEIAKIQAMQDSIMYHFNIYSDGQMVGKADLTTARMMTVQTTGIEQKIPFCVTVDGIYLQRPIKVNGATVQRLKYNGNDTTFIATDGGSSNVAMRWYRPQDYVLYDEVAGNYELYSYNNQSYLNVTLEPSVDGNTFLLNGFVQNKKVELTYYKDSGTLSLMPQLVYDKGPWTGHNVYMLGVAFDEVTGQGSVYFSLYAGLQLKKDTSTDGLTLDFVDGNDIGLNSFILVETTGYPSQSTFIGVSDDPEVFFCNGYRQYPFLTRMVKKN